MSAMRVIDGAVDQHIAGRQISDTLVEAWHIAALNTARRCSGPGETAPPPRLEAHGRREIRGRGGCPHALFRRGPGRSSGTVQGAQWPATPSADGWRPIFDHLAARFRVYAFDKLG